MLDGAGDPCLFYTGALLEHSPGKEDNTERSKNESALLGG